MTTVFASLLAFLLFSLGALVGQSNFVLYCVFAFTIFDVQPARIHPQWCALQGNASRVSQILQVRHSNLWLLSFFQTSSLLCYQLVRFSVHLVYLPTYVFSLDSIRKRPIHNSFTLSLRRRLLHFLPLLDLQILPRDLSLFHYRCRSHLVWRRMHQRIIRVLLLLSVCQALLMPATLLES